MLKLVGGTETPSEPLAGAGLLWKGPVVVKLYVALDQALSSLTFADHQYFVL